MDNEVRDLFTAYEAFNRAAQEENDCADDEWNELSNKRIIAECALNNAFKDAVKAAICN